MQSVDWQRIAPEVAKQLLGEPSSKKSHEWRYGTHGSLVVNIEAGTWHVVWHVVWCGLGWFGMLLGGLGQTRCQKNELQIALQNDAKI